MDRQKIRGAKRLSLQKMYTVSRVQLVDEAVCVLPRASALRKGMSSISVSGAD